MQPTRRQILDHLRRHGKGSVKDLGDLLGLTSTGIRQHLTILERDGLIEGHEERGRVGRPALVYSLTPVGDALYPKEYANLATLLLEEVRSDSGDAGVQDLLERAAKRKAAPYLGRLAGLKLPARVAEVARIMEEEGTLVSTAAEGETLFIHRLTCPYPDVARAHNDLCYLDQQFVNYLLQNTARLEKRLISGDGHCSYRIEPR
jgi:DeoR family transcriptional regulator, suf operon transcriptional repressor